MIFFQSTLIWITQAVLVMALVTALVDCGDPKYQPPAIVVTFDPNFSPPASLDTGAIAGIAADVANDPKNAGVNFTCAPTTQCGTFMPSTIASSVPTSYQAPPAVPAAGSVTVTATSVTDPTKFVSATITVD